MTENLSSRQNLILSYFEKHSKATSRELAEFLSVSERTVKNEIQILKNYPGIKITSKPGTGYVYQSKSIKEKRKLRYYYREKDLIFKNYDRVAAILHILLPMNTFIKYDEIADILFVSRSTLQKDMVKVKKLLNSYGLDVLQKPNYGVKVCGTEYNKRIAITYYFYSSFWGILNRYPTNKKYRLSKEKLNRIIYIVKNSLTSSVFLPDNMVEDLAKKVFVAIVRRNQKVTIPNNDHLYSRKIANLIVIECEKELGVNLVQDNLIEYIAHYIHGYNIKIEIKSEKNNELILKAILSEVYTNFDLDFSMDREIVDHLRNQIIQVIHRINMRTVLEDRSMFTYFKDYLFATKITISAMSVFGKMIGYKIPMGEYSAFILIFEAALMKHKKKRNIGIYLGNNQAEELLIYPKILEAVNNNEYIVSVVSDLKKDFKKYELVLTNYNHNNITSDVVKKVEFNKKTMSNINELLKYCFINQNKRILKKYISNHSLLYVKSDDVDEIKECIINHLDRGKFFKDIKDKGFLYSEIGNRVVHIQDLNKIIKKSICLLVVLDEPVLWANTLVEYLILIKTKRDGDSDLYYLCDVFSNLINDTTGLSEVKNNLTPNFLLEKLTGSLSSAF